MKQLLTEKEVAEKLRLAVQTLRNDRHFNRGLPYIKIGRAVRYDADDVESLIEQQRVVPGGVKWARNHSNPRTPINE